MRKIYPYVLLMAFCLLSATISAQKREYVIVVHGGAGAMNALEGHPELMDSYRAGLDTALQTGAFILENGGQGSEAVIATISYLEDNPLFNAGKGATMSAEGVFELFY